MSKNAVWAIGRFSRPDNDRDICLIGTLRSCFWIAPLLVPPRSVVRRSGSRIVSLARFDWLAAGFA
jgi:hypothetical protein